MTQHFGLGHIIRTRAKRKPADFWIGGASIVLLVCALALLAHGFGG